MRGMDVQRFLDELPQLFDGFPEAEHPRDRRFAPVLEEVQGLACENNLALLNLAASLLPDGESYVEIGTFRGTSLISAMLGNEGRDFVAIDDFSFRDGTLNGWRRTWNGSASRSRRSSRATRSSSSAAARSRAAAPGSTTTTTATSTSSSSRRCA